MHDIFDSDPQAQLLIGNRGLVLARLKLKKADYARLSCSAYQVAIRFFTIEAFPMYYAGAQGNLGNAYSTLAEEEDKEENCKRAIKAFEEALQICKRVPNTRIYESVQSSHEKTLEFCRSKAES